MIVNQNLYFYGTQVRNMPFYLSGIGGSEYQCHIKRDEGYHNHQFFYIAKGKGWVKYDNQTYELTDGNFLFMPSFYPHEYQGYENKWDVRWFAFDGLECSKTLNELHLSKPVIIKPTDTLPLQDIYNKLLYTSKTDKLYGEYTCSALVYQYIMLFHNTMLDVNKSNGKDKSQILLPVLLYIDNNYHHDFPLTDLAEISGITSQHLCRLFNETLNMKPTDYVRMKRITEAKLLLENTSYSINEIAQRTGFSSTGYFCTVFHQTEGISANNYRKKYNEAKI